MTPFLNSDESAHLSSLPVELLRKVLEPLPRMQLKRVRLADRRLNSIASERLFHSIEVRHNANSMRQLKTISASNIWSRQVKCISWQLPIRPTDKAKIHHKITPAALWKCYPYLHRLPNVSTVVFLNSAFSLHLAIMAAAGSLDLYSILRRAKLYPTTVISKDLKLRLSYTANKFLQGFDAMVPPDAPLSSSDDADLMHVHDDFSEAAHPEDEPRWEDDYPSGLEIFPNIATLHTRSLRRVTLSSVSTHLQLLSDLLEGTLRLAELTLTNARLNPCSNESMIEEFLLRIERRKRVRTAPISVTLDRVLVAGYYGDFSASDAELDSWVDGRQGVDAAFFTGAQEAFTPQTPNSSDDEGEDEIDDDDELNDEQMEILMRAIEHERLNGYVG